MNRRQFLRAGLAFGGMAAVSLVACEGSLSDAHEVQEESVPTEAEVSTPPEEERPEDTDSTPTLARMVTLNNGIEMPRLGIGTYILSNEQAEESVYAALMAGTRLIDTARIYGNEEGVGRGIVRAGVPREEVFLTTKLWTADFADAAVAIDASLMRLGQDYVDLLLLHHEDAYDEEAYRAMEEAVAAGKVRSIGISNFYEDGFDRIVNMGVANRADGCVAITHNEAIVDGRHPTFDLGFVTVIPVQAGFNRLHSVDKCVGYVLVLSDGTSVYVTGDTSTTDDMRDGTLAAMNLDYAFWCCDGVYNMGPAEAAEAAAMVGAANNIPYHNSTTDEGERFDREAAAQFAAPNAMVVYPGEDLEL